MSKVQRTWVVPEHPAGGYDRDRAFDLWNEIEHVLNIVGGMVSFVADREQVGSIGDEPLAISKRLIVTWQPYSPMRRPERGPIPKRHEPLAEPEIIASGNGFDVVRGEVDPRLARADPSPAELEEELARQQEALDGELEEEDERDLTTTGPPRPDAELE